MTLTVVEVNDPVYAEAQARAVKTYEDILILKYGNMPKVGKSIDATCLRCGEEHVWVVHAHLAPRMAMHTPGGGKQPCGNNAQLIHPEKM